MRFLKSKAALIATAILLLQVVVGMAINRDEHPPVPPPLATFPRTIGSWQAIGPDGLIEDAVQDVLLADDTLLRTFQSDSGGFLRLFVAYFASQRTGANPHSPKNCLPGAGWVPVENREMTIQVPGHAEPIQVNRYIIAKGENESAILYWYQGRGRYTASEYVARMYVVADSIRMNRTDTALVRLEIPVVNGDRDAAVAEGVDFIKQSISTLDTYVPR